MSVTFDMWRGMIEFATDVQIVVKHGWTISQDYGEERLRINDKMILKKGEEVVKIYDLSDLSGFIESLPSTPQNSNSIDSD